MTKFEDKIKNLEKIVNELEAGNVDIEDSIKKYTEAMNLVKECEDTLKNVEEQITKVVMKNDQTEELEEME